MMGIGEYVMEVAKPVLEFIAPMVPGEIFPYFFTMEMFQRALVAAVLVTLVAGVLGSFLLVRNLALIGDGLAHVSFGGVAVGVVLGASSPLWYALVFSVVSAILIHELQTRELLTGDASIAIFLTGMLALGLVVLRVFGGGITSDIEGYLFGSLLLIDEESLDLIATISIVSLISLMLLYSGLLSTTIDPLAARVQGLPVRAIGLVFSIITAAVVVSMVQVIGALLVTALLVTPAATGGTNWTKFPILFDLGTNLRFVISLPRPLPFSRIRLRQRGNDCPCGGFNIRSSGHHANRLENNHPPI